MRKTMTQMNVEEIYVQILKHNAVVLYCKRERHRVYIALAENNSFIAGYSLLPRA